MSRPWQGWLVVASVAFALRAYLIFAYPAIFGGDSVMRLANADRVLLAYQLPLLQGAVHLLQDVTAVRWFMAVVGVVASAGFYRLALGLMGEREALWAALLFATSPFITAFSIVPYQEILMLAGLAFAFAFFFEGWLGWCSLALGLACLTRYEAWIACPVLFLSWVPARGSRPPFKDMLLAGLAFGWAPLIWIAWNLGLTPEGSFAVESAWTFERFWRWVYLGWITVKNTPPPVMGLAVVGAWAAIPSTLRQRGVFPPAQTRRHPAQAGCSENAGRVLVGFVGLFLLAILFSAHGERDQPDRFVTAREAHVLLAGVCLVAGLGIKQAKRYATPLALIGVAWSVVAADRFVHRETSDPHVALSLAAAHYLDQHVQEGENVVVLAKPIPLPALESFIRRAGRCGIDSMLRLEVSPPDYQRILVQSRLPISRLESRATLPSELVPGQPAPSIAAPDWVVRWSDFEPSNDVEREIAGLPGQSRHSIASADSRGVNLQVWRVTR